MALIAVSAVSSEVSMITFAPIRLSVISFRISIPLLPGSLISRRTTSGWKVLANAGTSWPFGSARTSYPCFFNDRVNVARIRASSSMSNTFPFATMPPPPPPLLS